MASAGTRRRVLRRWLALAGALLVVAGLVIGVGVTLPVGILALLVAFVLSLGRPPGAPEQPAQDRSARRRSFMPRLLLLGLALVPAAIAIAAVSGNSAVVGALIPPLVIAVAVAAAVMWSGRFFLGAMAASAIMLLFAVAFFSLELRHPENFASFVPTLWLAVGSAVALGAAAGAFLQRRNRTLRPATSMQRVLVAAGVGLLVAGSATSWFVSGASRVTAAKAGGATVVTMNDNEFMPKELAVRSGDRARFYLVNEDDEPHTFTVDDVTLDEYIGAMGERLIAFDVPRSSEGKSFELVCLVSGHEDMDGTIVVEG